MTELNLYRDLSALPEEYVRAIEVRLRRLIGAPLKAAACPVTLRVARGRGPRTEDVSGDARRMEGYCRCAGRGNAADIVVEVRRLAQDLCGSPDRSSTLTTIGATNPCAKGSRGGTGVLVRRSNSHAAGCSGSTESAPQACQFGSARWFPTKSLGRSPPPCPNEDRISRSADGIAGVACGFPPFCPAGVGTQQRTT